MKLLRRLFNREQKYHFTGFTVRSKDGYNWEVTIYNKKVYSDKRKPLRFRTYYKVTSKHQLKYEDWIITSHKPKNRRGFGSEYVQISFPHKLWGYREIQPIALLYGLMNDGFPEGMQADHLCHNTLCINPYHCEPVTRSENMTRRRPVKNKKRYAIDTKRRAVKKVLDGMRIIDVALEMNINRSTIDGWIRTARNDQTSDLHMPDGPMPLVPRRNI